MMRFLRFWFLGAFFALTIIPDVFQLAGITITEPVQELRRLAPLPSWAWPPHPLVLVQQTNKWFNDHFGLRSFLIRLKTQIDFTVFGTSTRVHVGKDGWLFYRSVLDVEQPAVEELLSHREADILAGINALNKALRDKSIRLIIFSNLLKDRFYADKLPHTIANLPSPPRYYDFLAKLAALPDIAYVDTPAILRRTQHTRRIFHKTDFHWNDPAAFEVGRALVDRIAQMEGRKEPLWTHKLKIETKRLSGGIARFMPLFWPPSENGLFIVKTWQQPPFQIFVKQGIFEWGFHVRHYDPRLLPTVVVVGDSFFDGITRAGFPAYFNNMYRIRWENSLKLSEIAAALPPDTRYLVIQFIEVSYGLLSEFADHTEIAHAVEIIRARPDAWAATTSR
jgi:SGNH hydrolase-like domain, acetyltransferase AlgX